LGIFAAPLAIAVLASMAVHREVVPLPFPLWIAATVLLLGNLVLRWLVYCRVLGARLRDALGALLASSALSHVILVANLWGLLGREVPWRRPDKFKQGSRGIGALTPVRTELALGLSYLVLAAAAVAALPRAGMAVALAIGLVLQGFTYLAAPVLALVADRDLRRALDAEALKSAAKHDVLLDDRSRVSQKASPARISI
jgi:hypothetical protein